MNILYLHGLKSKLSPEKRQILEQYGKVYAPDIDYESAHIQPLEILQKFPETHFNVVIGSSMGALNAYIISENIGRPALLFNPPLVKYQPIEFKAKYVKGLAPKQILLGGRDEVVDPKETLEFLKQYLKRLELNIKVDSKLGHRIPMDIFETEVAEFFSNICY
ncbi:hypothetical protein GCM10023115_28110 [Pontixanthobacter gangjinensis]|uniref:Alpha/beta hydrolase n=1 Tax=Christiangramia aestuarii TaxID=1028746 RepID=A0A7K1LMJ7_9FLAO|nr:YqiA/YcfP family alpha/beta fold hydrolase [Christiangramia aestuarii]MUP42044.1 hypothetical protein [Christiangramia aestuarii]